MVERLIAPVLAIEPLLSSDAERDAGDCGTAGGSSDGGGDLRPGDHPEILRHPNQRGGQHGEGARHDHVRALELGCVHQRARGCGDEHPGDAAQRHDTANGPGRPAPLLQEDAQKRADLRLHVGHEEVQGFVRTPGALLVRLRLGPYHLSVPFFLGSN
jgi:hypothetical protein